MSQSNNSLVVKTFRPLLKLLNVQNIPNPPEMNRIDLVYHRDFVIKGMSRCVVVIEQDRLPKNMGGMLITSWSNGYQKNIDGNSGSSPIEIYKLHILINSHLCNRTGHKNRSLHKITVIHEFTHVIATLSALSKVRTENIMDHLKVVLQKKAHALYLNTTLI